MSKRCRLSIRVALVRSTSPSPRSQRGRVLELSADQGVCAVERPLRRLSKTHSRHTGQAVKANKVVQVQEARPTRGARREPQFSTSTVVSPHGLLSTVLSNAFRRWVVRYCFDRYIRWACKAGFNELPRQSRYGRDLRVHVAYQLWNCAFRNMRWHGICNPSSVWTSPSRPLET